MNRKSEIWVFDGSNGCEQCVAASGEYPYEPARPHPKCNCSIYKKEEAEERFCYTNATHTTMDTVATAKVIIGSCGLNCYWVEIYDVMVEYETEEVVCCKIDSNGFVTEDCTVDMVVLLNRTYLVYNRTTQEIAV